MKRFVIPLLTLVFLIIFTQPSFAHHKRAVLGETTIASELEAPAVTAGPGYILPDSPLYFIDNVFQTVRLATAFTPERRAKVRSEIAGERLAELRIMLSRNSTQGIATALTQLTKEVGLAASDLTDAAAQGKQVDTLAKEINDTIKVQRTFLGSVSDQANGSLKQQIDAASTALKEAKIEVEDELPEDELEHEIDEALEEEIEDEVEDVGNSSEALERVLEKFQQQASESAKKALSRREEAIRRAIENKNEALRREHERLLEREKKKQHELLEVNKKAFKEVREVADKSREAAKTLEATREETKRIESESVETTSESSGNSGSSENSGSGSSGSNSGSGSSNSGSDRDED